MIGGSDSPVSHEAMPPAAASDPPGPPLWAAPSILMLFATGLPLLGAVLSSEDSILSATGRPKPSGEYLSDLTIIWLAGALVVALCVLAPRRIRHEGFTRPTWDGDKVAQVARIMLVLSLVASSVWFSLGVLRGIGPGVLIGVFSGDPGALRVSRDSLTTIAGVTTLSELAGPSVAALVAVKKRLTSWERLLVGTALFFSALRVFLNAERLALLSVAIPLVIGLVFRGRERIGRRLALSGLLGAVGVITLFAVGELFRPSYQSRVGVGLGEYVGNRLTGYYLSAIGNGEAYIDLVPARPAPNFTASAFWDFPFISSFVTPVDVFGFDSDVAMTTLLRARLNPELNTVALLPSLLAEWGIFLAAIIFALLVYVLHLAWSASRGHTEAHAAIYSVALIAALESARYPYPFLGRAFVALLACVVIANAATLGTDRHVAAP